MCSYVTVTADVAGSAKGPDGWFSATSVAVYFDHPYHAAYDHTLNIDFTDASRRTQRTGGGRVECGVGTRTHSLHGDCTRGRRGSRPSLAEQAHLGRSDQDG